MAINIHKLLGDALLKLCQEKKLRAITVKDLLEETGVSRQTFYNRFHDKEDLIQWVYFNYVLSEFHKMGETGTYYENTLHYCQALEKYRFFMKQALQMDGQNNLRDAIFQYAIEYDYKWHLDHMDPERFTPDFRFISYYHSIASIHVEIDWVLSEKKDRLTPEQMAEKITAVRKISLSDTFFGPDSPVYEFERHPIE